jgi:hypothetical protein
MTELVEFIFDNINIKINTNEKNKKNNETLK